MKKGLIAIVLAISAACALFIGLQTNNESESAVPAELLAPVEAQLKAYNARDIEPFLAAYTDDVEVYRFPDSLIMKGKAEMRAAYEKVFMKTGLHAEIVSRTYVGSTVIDTERVTGLREGIVSAIAIYKIRESLIEKVYFIN